MRARRAEVVWRQSEGAVEHGKGTGGGRRVRPTRAQIHARRRERMTRTRGYRETRRAASTRRTRPERRSTVPAELHVQFHSARRGRNARGVASARFTSRLSPPPPSRALPILTSRSGSIARAFRSSSARFGASLGPLGSTDVVHHRPPRVRPRHHRLGLRHEQPPERRAPAGLMNAARICSL